MSFCRIILHDKINRNILVYNNSFMISFYSYFDYILKINFNKFRINNNEILMIYKISKEKTQYLLHK